MSHQTRRTFLKQSGAVLGGIAAGTTVTAATRTDRFIVETGRRTDLRDLEVIHELPGIEYAVVRGSEKEVKRAVRDYAPDVEIRLDEPPANSAAPTVEETSVADEPLYPFQWDKQVLDVPTAHSTTKGAGTRVSIIDTGVAAGHPDLEVNEKLSRNFTDDSLGAANPAGGYHGTHVGGIVAAQTDNEVGVAGTAPETELVDCRVFGPGPFATFGDILAAVVYSVAIDSDAANLSLGAYPVPRQAIGKFYGKVLNRVMTYANKEGTLLVVAAGNDAADLQHDKNFISLPNEGAQGLSIAATGPVGFLWDADGDGDTTDLVSPPESPAIYTNYGTNAIDLAAPGGDVAPSVLRELFDDDDEPLPVGWYFDLVFNTIAIPEYEKDEKGNITGIKDVTYTYSWVAGTSMAAPQVTGAVALVKSANPEYTAGQVEQALERAADVPDDYAKEYYGSGFLNLVDAL